jgi:hypothetical protein
MTQGGRQFRVDPRRIVHETIEGETILIDLETGAYFSFRGAAPAIWEKLVQGRSDLEVICEMQQGYEGDGTTIASATSGMIDQLQREGLLEPVQMNGNQSPAAAGLAPPPGGEKQPFELPMVERYTDMQYFLLLDPIHEVQETGWPHAAAENPPPPAA